MKPKPRFKKDAYLGTRRGFRGVEGSLPPQPMVRRYDGRPVRFDDAIGVGWSVIGVGVDPRTLLGDDIKAWEDVDATFATVFAPGSRPQGSIGDGRRRDGLIDLEDTTGEFTHWLRKAGLRDGSLLVLRPDKYVFGAGKDAAAITRTLREQFGIGVTA